MFYGSNRVSNPDGLYKKARCLRAGLAMDCEFLDRLWTDEGSTGLFDCSVWTVLHSEGALFTDFLYAHRSYNEPPNLVPKCIKESAVTNLYSS